MSNTRQNAAADVQLMNDLQDKLDFAMFEQEEMDPEKVREILAEMESMDPEADTVKAEFDKDLVWKKIQEQCREEIAEESTISLEEVSVEASEKKRRVKRTASAGKSAKVRRIALSAATIIIALFVGANIGTYATEKKGVIELVKEMGNGTSFWVTGDAMSMEFEEKNGVYYSWNEVPNEYKQFIIIPHGLPYDMKLYDVKVIQKSTHDEIITRYVDDDLKKDFNIHITYYQSEEFSFANMMYDGAYDISEQKQIEDIILNYYFANETEVIAQFTQGRCIYTINGTMDKELFTKIVENTIERTF